MRLCYLKTVTFAPILVLLISVIPIGKALPLDMTCTPSLVSGPGLTRPGFQFVNRYWNHPDIQPIALRIGGGESIDVAKYPFQLIADVSEDDSNFVIAVTHIANSDSVFRFLGLSWTIVQGHTNHFDPTLAKVLAGLFKGAYARREVKPTLHRFHILAANVRNSALTQTLINLGFQRTAGGKSLKLSLPFESRLVQSH